MADSASIHHDSTSNDFQTEDSSGQSKGKTHGKNAVEWTVFAFSCVLVTLVLGYLTYLSFASDSSPAPQLRVTLGQIIERDGQVWVGVTVENNGAITANNVEIEVEIENGQSAGFTLPHVPRHGKRQGWVGFEPPLAREELKARISGYQAP